jgi:D-sedoheptulose 7-phosphate isomerase
MNPSIHNLIKQSVQVKEDILRSPELLNNVESAVQKIVECYQNSGKVFFCGNGGSASDAQHLAAELSGRYYYDRPPLMAEALHVNSSFITAVSNDYGFEHAYARMIKACAGKGDILVALSTSGNSENIINCIQEARKSGVFIIGFTGETGGRMKDLCNLIIQIPSRDTPRIQEAHILLGHIICQFVESTLFPQE